MYTIKSLKTFMNRQPGFNVTLLRDGKPVADVVNAGDGGCFRFNWMDPSPATVTARFHSGGNDHVYRGTVEEARLWEHVRTLPKIKVFELELDVDPDMFVEGLVQDLETERQLKRWLKAPVAIVGSKILRWKGVMRPGVSAQIKLQHPNAIVLNDLPFEEALRLVKQHG